MANQVERSPSPDPIVEPVKFLNFRPRGKPPVLLTLNPRNIVVDPPQQRQGNQFLLSLAYILDGVRVPLNIQFPRMHSPFELGQPYDPERSNHKHVVLGFHGEEDRLELKEFRCLVDAIQSRIIEILAENSAEWFGGHRKKSMSIEVVRSNFKDLITDGFNENKKRQYPDNINIKIVVRRNKIQASFYDENLLIIKDTDALDLLGADLVAATNFSEIWFVNNNFFPKFKLHQAIVYQGQVLDTTFGIVLDSGSEQHRRTADQNSGSEDGDGDDAGWVDDDLPPLEVAASTTREKHGFDGDASSEPPLKRTKRLTDIPVGSASPVGPSGD